MMAESALFHRVGNVHGGTGVTHGESCDPGRLTFKHLADIVRAGSDAQATADTFFLVYQDDASSFLDVRGTGGTDGYTSGVRALLTGTGVAAHC